MKHCKLAFWAVLCCCGLLSRADAIATNENCKVALVAYMNGRLQVSMTGSDALALTHCEIRLRSSGAPEESDWSESSIVPFSVLGPGAADKAKGKYCSYAVTLSENTEVGFRALAVSGATTNSTDWITRENVRVEPFSLDTEAYTLSGSNASAYGGGVVCLKDGAQAAIVELSPTDGWVQLDVGSVRQIAGLRVVPRLEFPERLANAKIEVSENADMSDAQTVIASTPAPGEPIDATDWAFPSAVQGRYIRVTATTSGKVIDIAEAEPYSDRPDANEFSISVEQNAYNDAQPRIALAAMWSQTESWTLERAFSSVGPWDVAATGDSSTTSVVDAVPGTPSATYYYRVRFSCRTRSGGTAEITTPVVSHVYAKALERDWTDGGTALLSGVSVLDDCQVNSTYPTANAFNGNLSDFVATTDNPLIGLDFGRACHLTLAMAQSRTSGYGIVTPISLWGANVMPANTATKQSSDDPNYTELYRNAEAGASANLGYWYRFPVADPSTTFRYAFFHKNATDAAASNWGNLAEATFYGYDGDDIAAAQVIAPKCFPQRAKRTESTLLGRMGAA